MGDGGFALLGAVDRRRPLMAAHMTSARALATGRMVAGMTPDCGELLPDGTPNEHRTRRRNRRERRAICARAGVAFTGRQWRKLRKRLGLSVRVRA